MRAGGEVRRFYDPARLGHRPEDVEIALDLTATILPSASIAMMGDRLRGSSVRHDLSPGRRTEMPQILFRNEQGQADENQPKRAPGCNRRQRCPSPEPSLSGGAAEFGAAFIRAACADRREPGSQRSGSYRLKLDMVDQQVCWFEERGSEALSIPFEVRDV